MSANFLMTALIIAVMLGTGILAACGSSSDPTTEDYLTEDIPPCTPSDGYPVEPCEPDVDIVGRVLAPADSEVPVATLDEPESIRSMLDGRAMSFVPHLILRGTFIPDSVRCTSGNSYHSPTYTQPGLLEDSITMECFADVRVNSYIVGSGPPELTTLVDFHHYWPGYYTGDEFDPSLGITTEAEAVELVRATHVITLEHGHLWTNEVGLYGREVILFVGPPHNYATAAWEVYKTWDVQTLDGDSVIAVHPYRDRWRAHRNDFHEHRSALELPLNTFRQQATAAHQARVSEYGGQVGPSDFDGLVEGVELPMLMTDANQLAQFLADNGAYEHPKGTPKPPPPP